MTLPHILLFLYLFHPAAMPDEGQWLPQQFLEMDWEALKARGLALSRDEFWHPTDGGVLSAAVQISGCSASFVSADGLLVTNHHCGFGAIQQHSSLERNLVQDGFVAAERGDELPAAGIAAFVLKRIEDVTARVHAAQAQAASDLDRFHRVEREIAAIVGEAEKAEADVKCQVASFLNGRRYHLYIRTRLPDVRLVYAPPRSVGEFGGEEDNWMWPRHTGDFCFLRAYTGPDGRPAPFAKDNVPYQPKHRLKVSGSGVKEGDLVMVLGYPGRTERYLTSVAVKSREADVYPLRNEILTGVIGVLEAAGKPDARLQLALSATVKSLANSQKNALGMVKGLARNAVVSRKLGEEEAFRAWVAGDAGRRERYGQVLVELMAMDREEAATARRDEVLNAFMRHAPLLSALVSASHAVAEQSRSPEEREAGFGEAEIKSVLARLNATSLAQHLALVEKPVLALLLGGALALPADQRIAAVDAATGDGLDAEKLADYLAETTGMKDAAARRALFAGGKEAVQASDDPLVRLARGLAPEVQALRLRNRALAGRRLVTGNLWIEAQETWRGARFYPDANSTLRVSVATVKGYQPRDGVAYGARTTLRGVLEKETGQEPFASPKALLAAAREKDLGRFADPALGDVPVCFLSDADTTGGNSGSPLINGRGELVGLNFDRVFENVAGDFGWNADRSRNIAVDIRYVLWNLDKVLPAPALLSELGF